MSLIDMAFLKKRDITNGILSYRRKKTGQQLFIKWETCMQEIIDQYDIPDSPYLLPIISKPGTNERKQYINESHRINRHLKNIGKELGLPLPLTLYMENHHISISISTGCHGSTSGWKPPPLVMGLGNGSPSSTICTLRGSGAEWICPVTS